MGHYQSFVAICSMNIQWILLIPSLCCNVRMNCYFDVRCLCIVYFLELLPYLYANGSKYTFQLDYQQTIVLYQSKMQINNNSDINLNIEYC